MKKLSNFLYLFYSARISLSRASYADLRWSSFFCNNRILSYSFFSSRSRFSFSIFSSLASSLAFLSISALSSRSNFSCSFIYNSWSLAYSFSRSYNSFYAYFSILRCSFRNFSSKSYFSFNSCWICFSCSF